MIRSARAWWPTTLPNPCFIARHPDVGHPALLPPGQISQAYVFPVIWFLILCWSAFFSMVAIFAISFCLEVDSISWLAPQGLIKKLSWLWNKKGLQRSPPWERKQCRTFAKRLWLGKYWVASSGRGAAALDIQHRDESRCTSASEELLDVVSLRCK